MNQTKEELESLVDETVWENPVNGQTYSFRHGQLTINTAGNVGDYEIISHDDKLILHFANVDFMAAILDGRTIRLYDGRRQDFTITLK